MDHLRCCACVGFAGGVGEVFEGAVEAGPPARPTQAGSQTVVNVRGVHLGENEERQPVRGVDHTVCTECDGSRWGGLRVTSNRLAVSIAPSPS